MAFGRQSVPTGHGRDRLAVTDMARPGAVEPSTARAGRRTTRALETVSCWVSLPNRNLTGTSVGYPAGRLASLGPACRSGCAGAVEVDVGQVGEPPPGSWVAVQPPDVVRQGGFAAAGLVGGGSDRVA